MTNEELQNKVKELEEKLEEALKWIEQKKQQQISFPLDQVSKTIINSI